MAWSHGQACSLSFASSSSICPTRMDSTRLMTPSATGSRAFSPSTVASDPRHINQSTWRNIRASWSIPTGTRRPPLINLPAAAVAARPETAEQQLPFVLDSEFITEQCQETGLSETEFLTSLLPFYTALARPPISKFRVAAIGIGASGRAYAGVNLEIKGLPLHHSVHAEQFVVANAMQHGETRIRKIVVNHAPCGHCRQFLQELKGAEDISIVIADTRAEESSLQHFLPHRFGPSDLLPGDFPLLLEARYNGLSLVHSDTLSHCSGVASGDRAAQSESVDTHGGLKSSNGALKSTNGAVKSSNGALTVTNGALKSSNGAAKSVNGAPREQNEGAQSTSGVIEPLVQAALDAANKSYAPYSNSPSGVALKLSNGEIFAGSYMESAAYNPSLPPLQAAMVALVSEVPDAEFHDIVEAVLVEMPDAVVQYASSARSAVEHVNPAAGFCVRHAA